MISSLDLACHDDLRLPKITLFVDWSEESNKAIKSVLEAKRIIEMQSILELAYEIVDVELTGLKPSVRCPLLYFNNKVVFAGKAPTPDEVLQLVLSWGVLANEESVSLELEGIRTEPPVFGSAEMLV